MVGAGRCWGTPVPRGGVCLLISGDKALAVPCLTHNLTPPICACPPTTTLVPGTRGAASCTVLTATPDAPGAPWPAPRSGASLCECAPNQLLLCGGVGADGKPAADVWLLDVAELAWRCVYNGSSEQLAASGAAASVPHHAGGLDVATLGSACSRHKHAPPKAHTCMRALAPAGALLTLHDSKLACISAASAAPKLDSLATLDVFGLTTAYNFSERMRAEAAGLVQALELRAERQAAGLDLAAQPDTLAGNFDSLLRVRCPSWGPNSKHSSPSRAAAAAPCHHSLQTHAGYLPHPPKPPPTHCAWVTR